MSQDSDPSAQLPKWIPAGTAVLGAFFGYFGMSVGVGAVTALYRPGEVQSGELGTFVALLVLVLIVGAGLRLVGRRYRSPAVQAGALVGAGAMAVVICLAIWLAPSADTNLRLLGVLVGLGVIVVVFPLTSNPSRGPDEPTGLELLVSNLRDARRRLLDDEADHSRDPDEAEPTASSTGEVVAVGERLPVSRYWLVVGGAFVACLPISLVEPELGVGLLSAFLTAYALSHQVDDRGSGEDGADEDGSR
jgi:hypothetical protein